LLKHSRTSFSRPHIIGGTSLGRPQITGGTSLGGPQIIGGTSLGGPQITGGTSLSGPQIIGGLVEHLLVDLRSLEHLSVDLRSLVDLRSFDSRHLHNSQCPDTLEKEFTIQATVNITTD